MEVKVTAHDKSQKKYAKILESFLNADITTPIIQDITMTLISWEMMLGEEELKDILKVYLNKKGEI